MKLRRVLYRHCLNGYYRIKGIGIFAWVPVFVLYIFIPLANYAAYQYSGNIDMLYSNIVDVCRYLIPICSVWHAVFILYHFTEERGNEVLYISSKEKLADMAAPYALFLILLLPLFAVYISMFSELRFFLIQLLAINLFYLSFVYAAAFAAHTISVSVIGVLLYTIFDMMVHGNDNDAGIYFEAVYQTGIFIRTQVLPYVLAAIVLFVLGKWISRLFPAYK